MKKRLILLAMVATMVAIIAASAASALGGGIVNNGTVCNAGPLVMVGSNENVKPIYNAACVD